MIELTLLFLMGMLLSNFISDRIIDKTNKNKYDFLKRSFGIYGSDNGIMFIIHWIITIGIVYLIYKPQKQTPCKQEKMNKP